jgi:hypothetical protein
LKNEKRPSQQEDQEDQQVGDLDGNILKSPGNSQKKLNKWGLVCYEHNA